MSPSFFSPPAGKSRYEHRVWAERQEISQPADLESQLIIRSGWISCTCSPQLLPAAIQSSALIYRFYIVKIPEDTCHSQLCIPSWPTVLVSARVEPEGVVSAVLPNARRSSSRRLRVVDGWRGAPPPVSDLWQHAHLRQHAHPRQHSALLEQGCYRFPCGAANRLLQTCRPPTRIDRVRSRQ